MRAILGTTLVLLLSVSAGAGAAPDGGKPTDLAPHDAGPAETAGQKVFRNEYIKKTVEHQRDVTKGHVWTPDLGSFESVHWRRAYRALRIRELAEDEKEAAAVGRVDAYLAKLDQHFFTGLAALVPDAPTIPAGPAVVFPAAGGSLAIGTAAPFKITPVAGATHYVCTLWEPGGHYWSNYDPATKKFGTTPDCTMPAADPRWDKFAAGKAHFTSRAITTAKTKKGVEYNIWSAATHVDVTLTGGPK